MLDRLRIVVVDPVGKPPAVIYCGTDAVAADEAFETEAVNANNENVQLFIYPRAQRVRFPAQEAPLLKAAAEQRAAQGAAAEPPKAAKPPKKGK